MRCPNCKNKVIQQTGDTVRIRLRGAVELTGDGCRAQCHWCKQPIELPLMLRPDVQVPAERYLLRPKPR